MIPEFAYALPATFVLDAPDRLALTRALARRGHPARAYAILLDLHECARSEADTEFMVETADSLSDCAFMMARYEQGIQFARIAAAFWLTTGKSARAAGALSRTAVMLATIGGPDALAVAEDALRHAEESGEATQIIRALDAKGLVLSLLQQPDRGLVFNERAVAMSRRCNVADELALIDLAEVAVADALAREATAAPGPTLKQAVTRALALTREALCLASAAGDGWRERLAINNIAEYSLHIGDIGTARQALLRFDHAAGEPTDRCRTHHLMVRGRMLAAMGEPAAAVQALLACRTIALATGDLETATPCHFELASAHASLGDYRAAFDTHREYHNLYVRQASETVQRRARIFAMQREADELRAAALQAQALAADLAASNDVLAREADRLLRTSLEDPLTGMSNRRRLQMAFDELEATRAPFAMAMIDVDHFKRVNDTFCHSVGDAVLRRLADLLAGGARQDDLVVRYGGEEFAILIRDADVGIAERTCQRLRHLVEAEDWAALHHGLAITISVGIAASTEAPTYDGVLRLADQRLYAAKHAGRNRVASGPA